jgi:predicted deacetylase
MRYVILRDDDTNALTLPHCLERLYRPFLDRGLPVNLATIPEVDLNTRMADGTPEGYLFLRNGEKADKLAIGSNPKLVNYLLQNSGYHVVQHGCHHDQLEFDRPDRTEVARRIERGTQVLVEAGFSEPQTFVAPYDKLSRASLLEVAARFRVLSTGWFEVRRLPYSWWPMFAVKKARGAEHWRMGKTWLLSHPGCFLSCHRPRHEILEAILRHVATHSLTVLVTHWWEYFRGGQPDEPLIDVLHETADCLGRRPDVKMISFGELEHGTAQPILKGLQSLSPGLRGTSYPG